ncbi:helicase-related protein [Thiocapsa sp. UBA6158]|jgi:superfamily II DNA or RNA helicase|uniref:helicase-related protein n=1 Tax=Thiocapsa sp. UBA6158 TaxID=1947692 RepID=UPI0025F2A596|nr:helicase-related protein [Thiocapsa sp. UBA6158]
MNLQPGSLVSARGREWIVLPGSAADILHLRPLGAGDEESTTIYAPLEAEPIRSASFPPPDAAQAGAQAAGLLLRDALRLAFRSGAGPFRAFGNLGFAPRAYQLVPLLMALKLDRVRLLIADDVGIGKTIEAGLIVRELLDRAEITRFTVLCPPHLCDQWQEELERKFNIAAEVVTGGTAARLERGLPAGTSLFDTYPVTVVSLDYVKQDRRRDEFLRACPELVIVDEAHTCVQAGNSTRHQRYQVLSGLAAHSERHLILLTATPHSGDEEAFYNLLGLLDGQFRHLRDLTGKSRDTLRERLADHFVQRRRADIAEWQDTSIFPDRLSREAPYRLDGAWAALFNDVLDYAQRLVESAAGQSLLKQRMNWWAALALLRCISSSPAAAAIALRTRLRALNSGGETEQIEALDRAGLETVYDGDLDGDLSTDDSQPGARIEELDPPHPDAAELDGFIQRAEALRGPAKDGKLKMLIRQIDELLASGHNPVVFCRYIPTAHYVGESLSRHLGASGPTVAVITGELVPAEREERVARLGESERRILVATDCLSEGVNLQALFDAVLHYDLSWNPTRHEQREGRVDRFGQPAKAVRTVMLYGENNPVDGAVLQVILRKAERIRKELGVSVPMPDNSGKVMQAVMESVLLRRGNDSVQSRVDDLFGFDDIEAEIDKDWESAKSKAAQSRTIFAQRRLKPAEVLPEWDKAITALGSQTDVEQFVRRAAERLQAALEPVGGGYKLPLRHLPAVLRERLDGVGIEGESLRLEFQRPADPRHIHRSHPLVAILASYLAERALDGASPDLVARSGALFTRAVQSRTLVALLRLRTQLVITYRGQERVSLAEEALVVALRPGQAPEILGDTDAAALMAAEPASNMAPERRLRVIGAALDELPSFEAVLTELARTRAQQLLQDHRRVREASEARHLRYAVTPCLPVDVIGLYVLLPAPSL